MRLQKLQAKEKMFFFDSQLGLPCHSKVTGHGYGRIVKVVSGVRRRS